MANNKKWVGAALIVVTVGGFGLLYTTLRPVFFAAPLVSELRYPNFQTFPTPRTFDGPGTVFRIDQSGTRFPVAVLPVGANSGSEVLASYSTKTRWTVSALARYLSHRPGDVASGGNATITVKVTLGSAMRERSFDAEIDQLLRNAVIQYRKGSRYFVIRETISVGEIVYEFSSSGDLSAEAKAALNGAVASNQQLSWSNETKVSLDEKFDQPHRIFFTADELLVPGLGAGESPVQRVPGPKDVRWSFETDE